MGNRNPFTVKINRKAREEGAKDAKKKRKEELNQRRSGDAQRYTEKKGAIKNSV